MPCRTAVFCKNDAATSCTVEAIKASVSYGQNKTRYQKQSLFGRHFVDFLCVKAAYVLFECGH